MAQSVSEMVAAAITNGDSSTTVEIASGESLKTKSASGV